MEKDKKDLVQETESPENKKGIANWDTSNVENMTRMFKGASDFNNDLSVWVVEKIPEEPEEFDEGATSWELPRPIWNVKVTGPSKVFLDSFKHVKKTNKENYAEFTVRVHDDSGNHVPSLTLEDFKFSLVGNSAIITILEVVEDSESGGYSLKCDFNTDFSGEVFVSASGVVCEESLEIKFVKFIIVKLDLEKSKVLYSLVNDKDTGLATLTLKLYSVEGKIITDYYTEKDFTFREVNGSRGIEIVSFDNSLEDQINIGIKTDLSRALTLATFVEGEKLKNNHTINVNQLSSFNLAFGDYFNDGEVSNFTLKVTTISIVGDHTTGLTKDDFKLVEMPNTQNEGKLILDSVEEIDDEYYLLTIYSDKSYKGKVGLIVKDIPNVENGEVDVEYYPVPPKEIDYESSRLISGRYTFPEEGEVDLVATILNTEGNPMEGLVPSDFSVITTDSSGELEVIEINRDENDNYILSVIHPKQITTTFAVFVKGKKIDNSVTIKHPLEILPVETVVITGHYIFNEDDTKLVEVVFTVRDIENKFIGNIATDEIEVIYNNDDNLEVIRSEKSTQGELDYYHVIVRPGKALNGEIKVKTRDVISNNSIFINFSPIIPKDIDGSKSKVLVGKYTDELNTQIELIIQVHDADGQPVEGLITPYFTITDTYTENTFIVTNLEVDEFGNYIVSLLDYGVNDLLFEITINNTKIPDYLLEFPKELKKPVKTVSHFDGFVIRESERLISVLVEAYGDDGKLIPTLEQEDIHALLVPENEEVELSVDDFILIQDGTEDQGKYRYILKGNIPFSGKIGFYGEEVTIVIPTEEINYNPNNNVNTKTSKITNGEYDLYNTTLVKLTIRVLDWEGKPIRNLRKKDFVVTETGSIDPLYILNVTETSRPGDYLLTANFEEVRKATFYATISGVLIPNGYTLEHPIILKTPTTVDNKLIEYSEIATRRYIEALVVPKNYLGDIIEDLERSIFVSYLVDVEGKDFEVSRFSTARNETGIIGYQVQLYRNEPFEGKIGVSVGGVKATIPMEVNYDPIVIIPESPEVDPEIDYTLPVIEHYKVPPKGFVKLHTCDSVKTESIVDLSFFLDTTDANIKSSFVNLYISDNAGLVKPDINTFLMKDVPMTKQEVSKIAVGSGQSLYLESNCKVDLNVRLSGLTERNVSVYKGGSLSTITTKGLGIYELFRLDYPLAVYASGEINVINTSNSDDVITVWITDNKEVVTTTEEHRLIDKIFSTKVPKGGHITIHDLTIAPNERIYIHSKQNGVVVNLSGFIISAY